MRKRKSIVIIALILILGGFSLYRGWNLFHANEKIRDYFLERLRPVVKDKLSIETLHVSIGAVHLENVTIDFGDFSLDIDDVRIGYSFTSLIRYGFKPSGITNDVLLKKPVFRVTPRGLQKIAGTNNPAKQAAGDTANQQVQPFDFFKRITFDDGKIVYIDTSGSEIQLVTGITGWLNAQDLALSVAHAEGQLFNQPEKNLTLISRLNLLDQDVLQLNAKLDQCDIRNTPPEILHPQLHLLNGLLFGNLEFHSDERKIYGDFQLENAAIQFADSGYSITNINIDATLYDTNLVINGAAQVFEDSDVEIKGTIQNLLNPTFELFALSPNFNINRFWEICCPNSEIKLQGQAKLNLQMRNTWANPDIVGEFDAENVLINQWKNNRFSTKLFLKDSVLTIDRFESLFLKSNLKMDGRILNIRTQPELDIHLRTDGRLEPYFRKLAFAKLKKGKYLFSCTVNGPWSNIQAHGELTSSITNRSDQVFNLEYKINYLNNQLELISSSGNQSSNFNLTGNIDEIWRNPKYDFSLRNAQKIIPILYPDAPQFLRAGIANLSIQGNLAKSDIYFEIFRRNRSKLLILLTEIDRKDTLHEVSGQLVFNPESEQRVRSNFHFYKSSQFFKMDSLQIADFLTARGEAWFDSSESVGGTFLLEGARLSTLVGIFFPNYKENYEGNISGIINVEGNLPHPHINGKILLQNGIFNTIGTYGSELTFNFENNVFYLKDFLLNRDKKPIGTFRGFYNHLTKAINFRLNTSFFDVHNFLISFAGDSQALRGNGFVDLKMTNTIHNPQIDGYLQIFDGYLNRFKFDSLSCIIGKGYPVYSASNNSNFQSSATSLKINELKIKRNDEFELVIAGNIPYVNEQEMNLRMNGSGNFLALLPELTPYFTETKSNGKLNVEITGRPDAPVISLANLEFNEGYFKAKSVFDQVKDIHCKLIFDPRNRFLNLVDLSGKVRGEHLRISNRMFEVELTSRTLEPFYVRDWDLNLGVFQIETSSKGIPINIPGLMEDGERGFFQISGIKMDEMAYLAGPWQRPVVRGKLQIQNVKFTYPFLETEVDTNSITIKILESIDWDVLVFSKKDTRYVRTIVGAPDAVYVDLLINDGGQGLRFTGAIEDESIMLEGQVESSRGNVEYLDFNFRIEHAGALFDRTSIFPIVYGKARTTLIDSTGFSNYIWLTLYLIDPITNEKQEMGRWDEPNLYFELSSENTNLGSSEGEILTSLGYSIKNLRQKAPDILGISADNLLIKPILRPFERRIERMFGLDYVQFRSRIARNWLERNLSRKEYGLSKYSLLRNSRVMLGKYLSDRWFFLYKGELETPLNYQPSLPSLGLRHTLGIEYQIKPNLLLEMEYDYNSMLLKNREDTKIMLRHSFPF